MADDRKEAMKNYSHCLTQINPVQRTMAASFPRTMKDHGEVSLDRLLSTSQQLFSEEENSQSANRLLVTVQHSAAQDFQLESPDEVFGRWEQFVGKFNKEMENQ